MLCWRCRAEELKAKRQESGTAPVGEEAEVADAYEAVGKQVQQEAPQEFIERESHQSLFIVMGGVTPAKGDFLVGERDQSVVADDSGALPLN